MAERATIERAIRGAYAARAEGDLDGIMRHFADNAHFSLAGCPDSSPVPMSVSGAESVRAAMAALVQGFEMRDIQHVTTTVDGDQAAVHWKCRLRSTVTGREAETELVDLIRFDGDKIVSFRQFADTALASRLLAA